MDYYRLHLSGFFCNFHMVSRCTGETIFTVDHGEMHCYSVGLLSWPGVVARSIVAFFFEFRQASALPQNSGIDGGIYGDSPFSTGYFLSSLKVPGEVFRKILPQLVCGPLVYIRYGNPDFYSLHGNCQIFLSKRYSKAWQT